MVWIDTGYVHLLNNFTGTYTPSATPLDTVRGNFGGFIEKNIEKLFKNHDRKPGTITDIKFEDVLNRYNREESDLYELSDFIAKKLFNRRVKDNEAYVSTLFVLEVEINNPYLVVLELKRDEKYLVETDDGNNRIVCNPMGVPSATPKKTTMLLINLSDLSLSIIGLHEELYKNALGLNLGMSVREVAAYARDCFYNSIIRIDGRRAKYTDIVSEDKIEKVNEFEKELLNQVARREINFKELTENAIKESYIQRDFIKQLQEYKIPPVVKVLSDGKFEAEFIAMKTKRLRLKNGIEVIVPASIKELDPIVLQEVDGELVEVNEDVEM